MSRASRRAGRTTGAALGLAALALAGCPRPAFAPSPLADGGGLVEPAPSQRAPCAEPADPAPEPVTIDVQLLLPEGVDERAARRQLAKAATTLAPAGIRLRLLPDMLEVPAGPLIVKLRAPPSGDEQADARRAAAGLRRLLIGLGGAPHRLHVGVYEHVAAPDAQVLHQLGALDGLGLPGTADEGAAPSPLVELLGVGRHPPLALVRLAPYADDATAHEIGHALGLEHREGDLANWMHPRRKQGCVPILDEDQQEAAAAFATRTSRSSRSRGRPAGTSPPPGPR